MKIYQGSEHIDSLGISRNPLLIILVVFVTLSEVLNKPLLFTFPGKGSRGHLDFRLNNEFFNGLIMILTSDTPI